MKLLSNIKPKYFLLLSNVFQYSYWLLSSIIKEICCYLLLYCYFKMYSLLDDRFYICKLIKIRVLKSSENQKLVMLFVFRMSSICSSFNHIHLVQTKAPTFNKCCKKISPNLDVRKHSTSSLTDHCSLAVNCEQFAVFLCLLSSNILFIVKKW